MTTCANCSRPVEQLTYIARHADTHGFRCHPSAPRGSIQAGMVATVPRPAPTYTLETFTIEHGPRAGEEYRQIVVRWGECVFHANHSSRAVHWANEAGWANAIHAERAGVLTSKHYGPSTYGHVDYFVPAILSLAS